MMASEVELFGSVETSVFQGFGAMKSWPGTVVVVVEPLVAVVLGPDVEVDVLDDVVLELVVTEVEVVVAEVEVDVDVDAGFVVEVVVVVFFRAAVVMDPAAPPHWHASQG